MNKVFKVVFNAVRNKMMVVNEMTSSMQVGRKKARVAMVVGAALMALGGTANAVSITTPPPSSEWTTFDTYEFWIPNDNGDPSASSNTIKLNSDISVSESLTGGFSEDTDVTSNEITVEKGTYNGVIIGGYAFDTNATENTIYLTGGKVSMVVAAFVGRSGAISGNTVNIAGNVDLRGAMIFATEPNAIARAKNNTLNFGLNNKAWEPEKNKILTIAFFDRINFQYLEWEKEGTAVEVGEIHLGTNANDFKASIGVEQINISSGGIVAGDSMTLIAADVIYGELDEANSSNSVKVKINEGIATTYEGVECSIALNGTNDPNTDDTIDLTINKNVDVIPSSMNEQILVLGESRAAATAFTNQATDLIDSTLDDLGQKATLGMAGFAAIHGNASEYETGSHVDVNGWSMIVGASSKLENGTTVGAFFETGTGNYRTFNDLDGVTMRGDGESTYWGGGLLARQTFDNGFYAEGSVRVGKLENELKNAVKGSQGLTGYDIDTLYFGAHVGAGKVFELNSVGDNIDVYTKFLYTYNEGKNFAIDGDSVNYSSVTSERLRLGARYTKNVSDKLQAKVGAAWEYDLNGDSKNTVANYDLGTPSLGGSTFMADVGVRYQAAKNVSVDFSGRGYTGQRDGVSGQVNVKFSF